MSICIFCSFPSWRGGACACVGIGAGVPQYFRGEQSTIVPYNEFARVGAATEAKGKKGRKEANSNK